VNCDGGCWDEMSAMCSESVVVLVWLENLAPQTMIASSIGNEIVQPLFLHRCNRCSLWMRSMVVGAVSRGALMAACIGVSVVDCFLAGLIDRVTGGGTGGCLTGGVPVLVSLVVALVVPWPWRSVGPIEDRFRCCD